MTQDEAERAEAEAREELWNYTRTDERVRGFRDAIEAYTEAVRTTERLKAEALVKAARAALWMIPQGQPETRWLEDAMAAYRDGGRA